MRKTVFAYLYSWLALCALTLAVLIPTPFLSASTGDNIQGFAWSSNIGWISFNSLDCDQDGDGVSNGSPAGCPSSGTPLIGYGVNLNTETGLLSGYAWSPNIGWASFNQSELSGCPSGTCSARLEGNTLRGWAKALAGDPVSGWDGWISLSNGSYGVTLDPDSGLFSGFSWGSDVVGWLDWDPEIGPGVSYSVGLGFQLEVNKIGTSGLVTASDNGISCGDAPPNNDCEESYDDVTTVTLTATAGARSQFDSWTGDGCSGSSPTCVVTMDRSRIVNARFRSTTSATLHALVWSGQGILNVRIAGVGQTACDGSAPRAPDDPVACDYPIANGETVILTANPSANFSFLGWSDFGEGWCVPNSTTPCTFTADESRMRSPGEIVIRSHFGQGSDTPVTQCNDGNDNDLDGFVDWPADQSCSGPYAPHEGITAFCSAAPTEPRVNDIVTWSANVRNSCPSTIYTWFGDVTGTGDRVSTTYTTAGLKEATLRVFSRTLDDWSCFDLAVVECSVNVLDRLSYDLIVGRVGVGTGWVQVITPPEPNTTCFDLVCIYNRPVNTQVTLNAFPASGSKFVKWVDQNATSPSTYCNDPQSTTCSFALDANNKTIYAEFRRLACSDGIDNDGDGQIDSADPGCPGDDEKPKLTVNKNGTGTGTVRSNELPLAKITCGTDCEESYATLTTVTLTAYPDAGNRFDGWNGGGCSGTASTCVVTMDQSKTVTATFTNVVRTLYVVIRSGQGNVEVELEGFPQPLCNGSSSRPPGTPVVCNYLVNDDDSVSLSALPAANSSFVNWDDFGENWCTPNTNVSCQFSADYERSLTPGAIVVHAYFTNSDGRLPITQCNDGIDNDDDGGIDYAPGNGGDSECSSELDPHEGIRVSCTVSPSRASINQTITWTAFVQNSCGLDTYSWLDDVSGSTRVVNNSYSSLGTYNGRTRVFSRGAYDSWSCFDLATSPQCKSDIGDGVIIGEPGQIYLTTGRVGTGDGQVDRTVNNTPVESCLDPVCIYPFSTGTQVTLTAVPRVNSIFFGWVGQDGVTPSTDCTSLGPCSLTLEASKTVYADIRADSCSDGIDNDGDGLIDGNDPGCQVPGPGPRTERPRLLVQKNGTGTGVVTSVPTGINCGTDCSEHYLENTRVTIIATASVGSAFAGWSGGGCSGTNRTCVVTMNISKTVTATFNKSVTDGDFTLITRKIGTGSGAVLSNPLGINCGTDCAEVYTGGTRVTLTARGDSNSIFTGWSGGGCAGTGSCEVLMNADTIITASFDRVPVGAFGLQVILAGTGSKFVDSNPAGIDCGSDCVEIYLSGTSVTLTARAGPDTVFENWSGGSCSGSNTTCVTVMNGNKVVTATFRSTATPPPPAENSLRTGVQPEFKGGVIVPGQSLPCRSDECVYAFESDEIIEIEARADTGWRFKNWFGLSAPLCQSPTSPICSQLEMSQDRTVYANLRQTQCSDGIDNDNDGGTDFAPETGVADPDCDDIDDDSESDELLILTTGRVGQGSGRVGVSADGSPIGDCLTLICLFDIVPDNTVVLSASPNSNSVFVRWVSSDAVSRSPECPAGSPCSFLMDEEKTVYAEFRLSRCADGIDNDGDGEIDGADPGCPGDDEGPLLTVTKSGSGSGTVTSNPSGITCGTTCRFTFDTGELVTLRAVAGAGSTFVGWSSNCAVISATECTTTMNVSKTVNAIFRLPGDERYRLTVTKSGDGFGSVKSDPAGILCDTGATPDCLEEYQADEIVVLSALAQPGSLFVRWAGDLGNRCIQSEPTCEVVMNQTRTINAEFLFTGILRELNTGRTSSSIGSGTIRDPLNSILCSLIDCDYTLRTGATLNLWADADSDSVFLRWSGPECVDDSGNPLDGSVCAFVMPDRNTSDKAVYRKTECSDGLDNDGDARVDSSDPGCDGSGDDEERNNRPECSDGVDNADAEDLLADEADPGCYNAEGEYDPNDISESNDPYFGSDCPIGGPGVCPQCNDGIDNIDPEDMLADFGNDPGCHSPIDDDEGDGRPECSDGVDNADAEDYLADSRDPGCLNERGEYDPTDRSEVDPPPQCRDGEDNDDPEDTLSDYPSDPGCSSPDDTSEIDNAPECSDGVDNDDPEDTLADANDPACWYIPNDPFSGWNKLGISEQYVLRSGPVCPRDGPRFCPQCNDGVDNDEDGKIDHPEDPFCRSKTFQFEERTPEFKEF